MCDLDIDKAKYYGDKYKINIYSHYDEMLKTEKKIPKMRYISKSIQNPQICP